MKRRNIIGLLLLGTACTPVVESLQQEEVLVLEQEGLNLPEAPYNYSDYTLPRHFNANDVQEADNGDNAPISDWGATLGRALFYDTELSQNRTISCASCHQQSAGFSDPARFSVGFEGGLTARNSMGLSNARYYERGHFFWDERAEDLEEQVLMPIQDGIEMGLTLAELVDRLEADASYSVLFEHAYGSSDITTARIADALSQFVRSIVSYQAPYDEGRAQVQRPNDPFPNYTQEQNLGKSIFFGRGRCDNCHDTDLFIMERPRNIGLNMVYADQGLGAVTGDADDNGKFKVPSLRNVALTAPYMHDGRFASLAEVVNHYNSGIQPHPNLDNQLEQNGRPRRLNLDQQERRALVAFLETLTDPVLLEDEKFSDPFEDN
ncbi:MAG TPA: cytochrome-c peroxidase [Cytophagales bacterium]|nr:cytochrome-c peroxidase [Cytophagales bacterium]HAP58171.1 cytochrome-c peroxidase [Cytophagales bacterium]